MLVSKPLRYIFSSHFCFGKNHRQLKSVEQLISLNSVIQPDIDDAYTDVYIDDVYIGDVYFYQI